MSGSPQRSRAAAVVEAARRGDRSAMGELHAMYAPMVHAILLARVADSDVQDLVQDTFVQAMTQLSMLREPSAFGSWLASIARNAAASHTRRRRRDTPLDATRLEAALAAKGHGALAAAGGASASALLQARRALAAIRALPEAYRETLIMRLCEGMSGPEIAERSGLTAQSVRVNLHRGMRLLRQALGVEARGGLREEGEPA